MYTVLVYIYIVIIMFSYTLFYPVNGLLNALTLAL